MARKIKIKTICDEHYHPLVNILDFSNMNLGKIPECVFNRKLRKKVKELRLNGNNLADDDIKRLGYMSDLKKLDLSDNKITRILGIEKVPELRELDLSKNQIDTMITYNPNTGKREIPTFKKLERLNIGENKLKSLEGFDGMPKLKYLDLSDNKYLNIFKGLHRIESLGKVGAQLDLSGVPLSFHCTIRYVGEWDIKNMSKVGHETIRLLQACSWNGKITPLKE